MISKKYIKDLEFKTIEDIFEYIIESKINGNNSQVKELINKLSNKQFNQFTNYVHYSNYAEFNINTIIKYRF